MYKLKINPGINKALMFFTVILASMMTVVILSGAYKSNASNENSLMMRKMRSWSNKIDEANRNNQILVQHEDTFKKLVENSVIGDENRLSWVEAVQKVAESRKLSSVKYNIASRVLLDKKGMDRKYTDIDVYKSVMSLDMKILHEGDLFAMLDALKSQAKGLVAADKCNVELLNKNIHENIIQHDSKDNMRASCAFSWYTLKQAERG